MSIACTTYHTVHRACDTSHATCRPLVPLYVALILLVPLYIPLILLVPLYVALILLVPLYVPLILLVPNHSGGTCIALDRPAFINERLNLSRLDLDPMHVYRYAGMRMTTGLARAHICALPCV